MALTAKAVKADLGVAFDGDADRSIFVDEKGKIHWGDKTFSLIIKHFLIKNPLQKIVTPVSSSTLVKDTVRTYHGKLIWTKVGSVTVSQTMKKENAIMGLEETGKNIWPNTILYGDWVLATLKMLEIIGEERKSLSDIVKTFPQFYMKKEAFYCPENLKEAVLTQALKEWRKRKEEADVVTIDGARINYLDGSWILFRPSGSEPVFRVYSESIKPSRIEELANMGSEIIKKSLRTIS